MNAEELGTEVVRVPRQGEELALCLRGDSYPARVPRQGENATLLLRGDSDPALVHPLRDVALVTVYLRAGGLCRIPVPGRHSHHIIVARVPYLRCPVQCGITAVIDLRGGGVALKLPYFIRLMSLLRQRKLVRKIEMVTEIGGIETQREGDRKQRELISTSTNSCTVPGPRAAGELLYTLRSTSIHSISLYTAFL